ncbi:kinase-like domain-containing protein [Rhizophagus clarus]|uniref:Kinase-like domain-containing protein n=1 Tax=Rhizophagus clarus TaxID=94130 RepID=A0A8H3QZ80_9GLOM|nr:kinase-like domain-containing protein [Rhizophagus clarus]
MNTGHNLSNFYDPIILKYSPVPALFIPFKNNEEKCNYCGIEYSKTLEFEQKYCKNCLFWYNKYMSNNTFLDKYIKTKNIQCIEHETTRNTTNFQERREHCSEILCLTHLIPNSSSLNKYSLKSYSGCCGSFEVRRFYLYERGQKFNYCISSEWVECCVTKKPIQILYLSWWDNFDNCIICLQELKYMHKESITYCQKWFSQCFIIYTGCRYCLTTNIVFGITSQSQCKKCKRIFNIDITNIISKNYVIGDFILIFKRDDTNLNSLKLIRNLYSTMIRCLIKWIPYSQFKDLKKIGEGGFSSIYKATWTVSVGGDANVALKKLYNSQNISKYFFNEIKSLSQCIDAFVKSTVIRFHGITQDPGTKEFMLIIDYADGGNLHNYLQKNFLNVTWIEKLIILRKISYGIKWIHDNKLIHRDLHSGNILSLLNKYHGYHNWLIGDFGLSQPANNISPNNEIYGVIPYIAPEIFKGGTFSKESDIYSFGMIMWELTTGCKPFANVEHNISLIYEIIDGKRPEITNDTPECFANLMKKCWDPNPLKRPSIDEIVFFNVSAKATVKAEKKRLELIQLKRLGSKFNEKSHSKAIFTSRKLNSFLSIINFSINSFNIKQEYITKEYELDINKIQSSSTQNINSSAYVTNSQHQNVNGPLNNLISTETANSLRKRDFEELNNIETQKVKKNKQKY